MDLKTKRDRVEQNINVSRQQILISLRILKVTLMKVIEQDVIEMRGGGRFYYFYLDDIKETL